MEKNIKIVGTCSVVSNEDLIRLYIDDLMRVAEAYNPDLEDEEDTKVIFEDYTGVTYEEFTEYLMANANAKTEVSDVVMAVTDMGYGELLNAAKRYFIRELDIEIKTIGYDRYAILGCNFKSLTLKYLPLYFK